MRLLVICDELLLTRNYLSYKGIKSYSIIPYSDLILITDTALRGAATLRARLHKVHGPAIALNDENVQISTESNTLAALDFVTRGEEILKCTRKGNDTVNVLMH